MRRRNILIGALILAVLLLGGAWLLVQPIPLSSDARERKCVADQRRVLTFAYVQLEEGTTWEQFEAEMLAYCECFARGVSQRLTPEELALLDRQQSTPAIEAKFANIFKACRTETP